jgi:hypothetical protein
MGVGELICTKREVVAVVDRSKDVEDEEAMSVFVGSEGDADEKSYAFHNLVPAVKQGRT